MTEPKQPAGARDASDRVAAALFGVLPDGRQVRRFTLSNAGGATVEIVETGAAIRTLLVPDRRGALADVVLGFDAPGPYLAGGACIGAVAGRFANRIAKARFTLDGRLFVLTANDGAHTLHGGAAGFDRRLWRGGIVETRDGAGVRLTLESADGEEGFPGRLTVSVTYVWTDACDLLIDYEAQTDAPTVVNLTQHSYFNLSGSGGAILDHTLEIPAELILPVDPGLIPTGAFLPVEATPFDFRTAKVIGRDIDAAHEQLRIGGGYDHTFVVSRAFEPGVVRKVAVLGDPVSGRRLTVESDQPGVQVYSGNFLDGSVVGKAGAAYPHRGGLCLETQHFPDSPNQPGFPTTRLEPGGTFRSRSVFRFSVIA